MNGDWLPSGWEIVQIGDLVKPARRAVAVEPDTLYREIGIRSHGKGIFYKEPISGKDLGDKRVFWVEPGCFVVNIVFAWEGAVAQTTPAEAGMIASHRFPMYKPDADRLDLDFITYFFKSKKGIHLLGLASPGGAGRNKTLGQQNFLQLEIPLPPLKEQRKLAAILQTCDEAISLTEQLIVAKQRRKQALMQRLLTGKVRFPGFSDEELSIGRFDDFIVLQRGFDLPVSEREAGAIKVIASNGQVGFHIVSKVKGPGVITGRSGTIGNVHYEENDFWPLNTTLYVKDFKGNYPLFVFYFLQQFHLERFGTGSGVPTLNRNDVHQTIIQFPILDEQIRIAQFLHVIDEELDLHQQKLAALRRQKQGLMQQLLTGWVRVAG